MRRDKWTTRCWKFLKGNADLQRREIESINLSESLRSEIKLFSCNFYDMYPFSIEMPLSSQCGSRCDFVAQRTTSSNIGECRQVQRRRDSEIEGRTFSKDDENGAFGELSRFVTPKDFERNRYHLIAVSVEWFLDFVVPIPMIPIKVLFPFRCASITRRRDLKKQLRRKSREY